MVATTNARRERASTSKAAKPAAAQRLEPSEDGIRIRAYQLYERRVATGGAGDDKSDWIEAERQLLGEE